MDVTVKRDGLTLRGVLEASSDFDARLSRRSGL